MQFQREVAVLMMLLGLLVLSNGEDISSTSSEEGEMVEQAVRLEQLVDQVEQPPMENRSEEKFLSTRRWEQPKDMKSYAKKVTVTCSLPTCSPLVFHYVITEFEVAPGFFGWVSVPANLTSKTPFVAHFELDGPADEYIHFPPKMLGEYQNPTVSTQQYHYKGETGSYYFLKRVSLSGQDSSDSSYGSKDDLQFYEYEMKYKANRNSTYTLFDFRDGEKYSDEWSSVLDSDGVNGYNPAYINWRYDIEDDEFLIEIADHLKTSLK